MRIIYLLILCVSPMALFGQFIDFESATNDLVIDTTAGNLWQIGVPNKIFLDGARSPVNAIITDTTSAYPANNSSSFSVIPPNYSMQNYELKFYYKIDSELGVDGGYVEFSSDEGITWQPLYNGYHNIFGGYGIEHLQVYNLYEVTDTLYNGKSGISGNKDWTRAGIDIVCMGVKQPIIPHFRFTFISNDSISGEGWMIDDFDSFAYPCTGSSEDLNKVESSVYPNPISTRGIIELEIEKPIQHGLLQIYNTNGQRVAEQPINNKTNIELDVREFNNGVHFYQLTTDEDGIITGQFIVNKDK